MTPLRARNKAGTSPSHPKGGLLLLWSASIFVPETAWTRLYAYTPFRFGGGDATLGWERDYPYPIQGVSAFPCVPPRVGHSPYDVSSGSGYSTDGIPIYSTDEDPLQLRVWAYTVETSVNDIVHAIPWGWTPDYWALSTGNPNINLSHKQPFQGKLIITANLLRQILGDRNLDANGSPLTTWFLDNASHSPFTSDPYIPIAPWNFQVQGVERSGPQNIYEVELIPFTFVGLPGSGIPDQEGWGWQGTIIPDTLDDSLYRDPYRSFPVPPGVGGNPFRETELLKYAAEPLGHLLQLKANDGTLYPVPEAFRGAYNPVNGNMWVSGLVNHIYVYQYYRVSRVAASMVSMIPTVLFPSDPRTLPTSSPFIDTSSGFLSIFYTYLMGTTVDNPVSSSGDIVGVGTPGIGWPFGIAQSGPLEVLFPAYAGWKSITSLYYNEFMATAPTIPPNNVLGSAQSQFYNGLLMPSGIFPQDLDRGAQIYSTIVRDTLDLWECQTVFLTDPATFPSYDLGFEPGPVDTMAQFVSQDAPPFFSSITSYWVPGFHRRALHGWSLTKTEEEMYDISASVGDSLTALKAQATTDLTNTLAFTAAHANIYYAGNYVDTDNLGIWIYGVLPAAIVSLAYQPPYYSIFGIYVSQALTGYARAPIITPP